MARQQIDLRPEYEAMGAAAATATGCGAGFVMMLSGLFHFEGWRFLKGASLIVVALLLGLGFAIDQELRMEEKTAEFMAYLD
ncbi:MAG TPA: hypothetical protein VIF43_04455 [Patescibacteria group bacterium]